jgi:hypothetical protein
MATNTDAPVGVVSRGNAELFAAHRSGYQDAMARRAFPLDYDT